MVLFLHFLCLSRPLSLTSSIWFHCADDDDDSGISFFPFVCLRTQTNALISSEPEVRLCKPLFIKHIDSSAGGIKNTWSSWEIPIRASNEILLRELICFCLRGQILYPFGGIKSNPGQYCPPGTRSVIRILVVWNVGPCLSWRVVRVWEWEKVCLCGLKNAGSSWEQKLRRFCFNYSAHYQSLQRLSLFLHWLLDFFFPNLKEFDG